METEPVRDSLHDKLIRAISQGSYTPQNIKRPVTSTRTGAFVPWPYLAWCTCKFMDPCMLPFHLRVFLTGTRAFLLARFARFTAEVSKKSQYVALGDYRAESSDELSLTRGDLLTHMNKDPGGWTRVKHNDTGENGWVPTSYLQQVLSNLSQNVNIGSRTCGRLTGTVPCTSHTHVIYYCVGVLTLH